MLRFEEHAHLAPRLLEVALRQCDLRRDRGEPEPGLGVDAHLEVERAPPAAEHPIGARRVAGPEGGVQFEPLEMCAITDRRIELEGAVEELVGAGGLAERGQRPDQVRHQHGARGSFDSALPRPLHTLLGDAHRVLEPAEQMQGVGLVHPEPQPGRVVVPGQFPGQLQVGQARLDGARGQPGESSDVRRNRHPRPGADLGRLRVGIVGGADSLVEPRFQHQPGRQFAEDIGTKHAGRLIGEHVQGLPEEGDGPDLADVREVGGLVPEHPGVPLGVRGARTGDGFVDQGDGAFALAGVAQDVGRFGEQVDPAAPGQFLGIRNLVPEFDRPLSHSRRRGEGVGAMGLRHRGDGGCERLPQVVRGHPVVGDRRGVGARLAATGFEGLGVSGVEPPPLFGQELVMDGFAHERVTERVGDAELDEHPGDDGRSRGRVDVVRAGVADEREQLVFDPYAAGREQPHDPLGVLAEQLVPGEQDAPKGLRHALRAGEDLTADQFLDEERDAIGALVHKADLPLVGRRTEDADGHLAHLGAGQPRQFAPLSAPVAVEFGQPGPERASPAQLVAAESEHEEDAVPLDHPDEVSQQPEGALVGPVQVLDHEYERMNPGRGLEGAGNGVVDTVGAEPAGRTGFGWGNGAVRESEFGQE